MDVCGGNGKTSLKFLSSFMHFVGKNLSLATLCSFALKLSSVVEELKSEDLFIGIYYFVNQGFCPL